MHPSVPALWQACVASLPLPDRSHDVLPPAWSFCDNQVDADACARLVLDGIKRATSPSLWSFERSGEPLPEPGDLDIVTDWGGRAVCVIRTTRVQVLAYDALTERHAAIEGEGDGTLAGWRSAHWPYYHRELEGSGRVPAPDMPIVFQQFERIFPPRQA